MHELTSGTGQISGNRGDRVIRRGCSTRADAEQAVDELAGQLNGPGLKSVIFFCSPAYDLEVLGKALRARFDCPVLGCTTAGEIFSPHGYLKNSLVGIGFASPDITMTPLFIPSLTDCAIGSDASPFSSLPPAQTDGRFALLMIDGLAMLEERVLSVIQGYLHDIPLIGGSAGDGLDFHQTHVYHDGCFHQNAAVVALFETTLPFKLFRIQHFTPTGVKLVITEADPATRTVAEINGLPAAEEYARIVGMPVADLSPGVFAAHPLMVRIGGQDFVRSINKIHSDGSLTFYCAIDNGLVLTLAKGENLLENLRRQLEQLAGEIPDTQLVLGFDCILRRIEVQDRGEEKQLRDLLAPFPYLGFCTYGEQYNGIHVNQTLTGMALGGSHA